MEDDFGERSPSPDDPGGEHDEFVDAFDTIDEDEELRTPRASVNNGTALSPVLEAMANSPFHDLSPQEQVSRVESEGGIPFELCRQSWTQEVHSRRVAELLNATKERVAREKNVDRAATYAARRRMSTDSEDTPETSLYDQAKGMVGRLQMGQDITKFELPATFLTPFSAILATEDVLTIISGTERSDEDWKALSDLRLDCETRFLNVLRLFLDMESLRCEEGTSGGTKSAFTMPPMKKPINSVLGETHRTRVGDVEMIAEQVSHHPPITCWEVEHKLTGMRITGNLSPKPIFHGTSVQVALRGTLLYEFPETGEAYVASIPDLYIRFFGLGGGYNENVGRVRFERVSGGRTGDNRRLWADLHFKARGSAGWKSKAHRMDATVYRDTNVANPDLAPSTSGGVVGLGYGFLENFSEKTDVAFNLAKASAPKWCAKNYAGDGGAGVEVVAHIKVARRLHCVGRPPIAQPLCVHVEPSALAVPRRPRHAQHTDGRGHAAKGLECGGVKLERLIARVDRDEGHRHALQCGGNLLGHKRLLKCQGGARRADGAAAVVRLDAGVSQRREGGAGSRPRREAQH